MEQPQAALPLPRAMVPPCPPQSPDASGLAPPPWPTAGVLPELSPSSPVPVSYLRGDPWGKSTALGGGAARGWRTVSPLDGRLSGWREGDTGWTGMRPVVIGWKGTWTDRQ